MRRSTLCARSMVAWLSPRPNGWSSSGGEQGSGQDRRTSQGRPPGPGRAPHPQGSPGVDAGARRGRLRPVLHLRSPCWSVLEPRSAFRISGAVDPPAARRALFRGKRLPGPFLARRPARSPARTMAGEASRRRLPQGCMLRATSSSISMSTTAVARPGRCVKRGAPGSGCWRRPLVPQLAASAVSRSALISVLEVPATMRPSSSRPFSKTRVERRGIWRPLARVSLA
jgi:hypothetical protein